MSRFFTIMSGSRGNCTYIGCGSSGILVDAGGSAKSITEGLRQHCIDIDTVRAILITHEHTDHSSGLRVLASRYNIPVYTSEGTMNALEYSGKLTCKFGAYTIDCGEIEIGGMNIRPFRTSHDCAQSFGYIITTPDDRKFAVCTDLGYISGDVREALRGCDLVMLESNHDVMMLQNGSYPYPLKRRILGDTGHLSNAACAEELCALVESGTTRLVLAHLSRENNHPEVALATARAALCSLPAEEGSDFLLSAAAERGGTMITL